MFQIIASSPGLSQVSVIATMSYLLSSTKSTNSVDLFLIDLMFRMDSFALFVLLLFEAVPV